MIGVLHVDVDHEQCFGYQRCVQIAPNTFSVDDAGNSVASRRPTTKPQSAKQPGHARCKPFS